MEIFNIEVVYESERGTDSYGYVTEPKKMVFKVTFEDGTAKFYMKKGSYSSYGDDDWAQTVEEVQRSERSVTYYE